MPLTPMPNLEAINERLKQMKPEEFGPPKNVQNLVERWTEYGDKNGYTPFEMQWAAAVMVQGFIAAGAAAERIAKEIGA